METNDYCSYEFSKKLKEAGFDEPCDHYWYKAYSNSGEMKMRQASADDYNNDDWNVPHCSAPTLWHAQKWLREKKELYANCFWNAKGQHWQPHCQWMNEVQGEPIGYAEFYEEGLSMAITAALELIKKGE